MHKTAFIFLVLFSSSAFSSDDLILPKGAEYKSEKYAKVVKYCPDNTCDVFQASKKIPINDLKQFSALYFYYVSGYIYLEKPIIEKTPFRKKNQDYVHSVLEKHAEQCKGPELEAASCVLTHLAKKWNIKSQFIRYDEGENIIVTQEIEKELSIEKLQSTQNWYRKQ